MIGHQCIECGCNKTQNGIQAKLGEGRQKITDGAGQQNHLKSGIERKGDYQIVGKKKPDMIPQFNQKRVHPWVVVAVWDDSERLFKLVYAVRRHDARILIEKIRKPADQAAQYGTTKDMLPVKRQKNIRLADVFHEPLIIYHIEKTQKQ